MAHKILAIDDHRDTLNIVVMTLKGFGYEVVSSNDPVEGLKLAATERPDLALIDMNMPVMDGIEVVKKLRAHPELGQIPIIMFTAENQPSQKKAGFSAGVDDYLTKPTEPEEMLSRIEEMLKSVTPNSEGYVPPPPQPVTMLVGEPSDANSANEGKRTVIGVFGVRGGVGTTMLAINLAMLVAARKRPVTLVDLDWQQGHIAFYLNRTLTKSMNALVELPASEIGEHLVAQITDYRAYLQLLLSRSNVDGRFPYPSEQQVDAILDTLSDDGQVVIVDLGRNIASYTYPVLSRANQILLCLEPERLSLSVTKQLLSQLETWVPATTEIMPVLIENGSENLPRMAVEEYIGRELRGIIPFAPVELSQSINKGAAVVQLHPKTSIAVAYHQLAKQLRTISVDR